MREVLAGRSADQLVVLDIMDCIGAFNGTGRIGYYSWRDWLEACRAIGSDANVIVGEKEYFPSGHPLSPMHVPISDDTAQRRYYLEYRSSAGRVSVEYSEADNRKRSIVNNPLAEERDFDALIGYLRLLRSSRDAVVASLAQTRAEIGELGLMTVFVSAPMEMYYVLTHGDMVLGFVDYPDKYAEAMAEVEQTSRSLIRCAAEAGADMIMFGGAGTEIFSPTMIDEHVVAPEVGYANLCRESGLFSLMHCCGRTRILQEHNAIGQVRPTVFESFTSAPLGDIVDPVQAARELPRDVLFKGGLSLDTLLRGSADEVAEATRQALADFGSRPFILSGTCSVLTGTPRGNLLAVTAAADDYAG